ncbi:DedA family protein [Flavimaricola marinus]|uniref:Inner membrane protein YabI n=1 Tax=Flavimaricola marinus TaxID=1819565 RepID=A0A238LAS3_9RHOB|nr:DedA family protein [Flavimaricola marinus]SMY06525.1 Inner membrane protein YabI [Flavimaricola marinus]
MTDTLLALLPIYGPGLILMSVLLSCLAVPIPSSMLVMVAGGFAASGDLLYWQVFAAAFVGFVIGDQGAFHIARRGGPPLIDKLKLRPRIGPLVGRAEAFVDRRGGSAVFLSRTVASPLGPYVGYLSGALGFKWLAFTVSAVFGALIWSAGYSYVGFQFGSQIDEISALMSNMFGVIVAGAVAIGSGWWLRHSWRSFKARHGAEASS